MITLCKLFSVSEKHFNQTNIPESMREVDFYLINNGKYFRCEVKLMGKGNPESADAIFARKTNIFIADKLSDLNKKQADNLNTYWVELRSKNGYLKFQEILKELEIKTKFNSSNLDEKLDIILNDVVI